MYAERSTPTIPFSAFVCLYISEIDMALQPCQKEFLHVMIYFRLKLNNLYTIYIRPLPSWPPFFSFAFSLFVRSFSFILSFFLSCSLFFSSSIPFIFLPFISQYSSFHCSSMSLEILPFHFFEDLQDLQQSHFFFHLRCMLYIVSTRPCPLFFLLFDIVCLLYFDFPLLFFLLESSHLFVVSSFHISFISVPV